MRTSSSCRPTTSDLPPVELVRCFWCSVCRRSSPFHWCNNVQYSSHVMSDDVIHDSRTAQIFRCHMMTAEVRIMICRDATNDLLPSKPIGRSNILLGSYLSIFLVFGHSNTSGQYSQKLNSAHPLIYFLIFLHYDLLNMMYQYKWQQCAFSYLQPREV